MKSILNIGQHKASTPLLADDLLEFHAARLLLLFKVCGTAGRIDGLTKMAKLDFFVRYPQFFDEVCTYLKKTSSAVRSTSRCVESSMVRFHYGPWDHRYYHILAYLESRELIIVEQDGQMFRMKLSTQGRTLAGQLESSHTYTSLVGHMKQVKTVLGGKAGSTLKDLVYKVFGEEVAERPIGEIIK